MQNQKWAPILESAMGKILNAFCVTNHHDMQLLLKLKEEADCKELTVITGSEELFDFSHGEPDEHILTVLRVLDIEDEFVKRQLINALNIERCALVEKRVDGDRLMRGRPRNVKMACSLDLFRLQYSEAGSSTQAVQPYKGPPRLSADIDDQLARLKRQLSEHEKELQDEAIEIERREKLSDQLRKERNSLIDHLDGLKEQESKMSREQEKIEFKLSQILSTTVAALKETLTEYLESYDEITKQKNERIKLISGAKDVIKDLAKKLEEIDRIIDVEEENMPNSTVLQALIEERTEEVSKVGEVKRKLDAEQKDLQKREENVTLAKEKYKQSLTEARSMCNELPVRTKKGTDVPMTTNQLQKLINNTTAKFEAARQKNDLDVILQDVKGWVESLAQAQEQIKDFQAMTSRLKNAITLRQSKWYSFRRHIALRAKILFHSHLRNRQFIGNLRFNHQKRTLAMKINTDIATGEDGYKNPDSLSGGERSFGTICLLLSLWDAIGSPIRCLDEYDVHMDALNRRESTDLLANAAQNGDGFQYILLSPNLPQIEVSDPRIRIHCLKDPVKNQTTLT